MGPTQEALDKSIDVRVVKSTTSRIAKAIETLRTDAGREALAAELRRIADGLKASA